MLILCFLFQLIAFFYFALSLLKSAEFTEMCPRGKGFVPVGESSYSAGGENYKGQHRVQMSLQRVSAAAGMGPWLGWCGGGVLLGCGNWWPSPLFHPGGRSLWMLDGALTWGQNNSGYVTLRVHVTFWVSSCSPRKQKCFQNYNELSMK